MHRVDSFGYKIVGVDRRHEDQNLPGTPGTVLAELWKNAVQEEIAHLIEFTGASLNATGLIDEASDWQQLRQAIFSSAKIDSAAITDGAIIDLKLATDAVTNVKVSDVSVDKLTLGTIAIADTIALVDYVWNQTVQRLRYDSDGASGHFETLVWPDYIQVKKFVDNYVALLEPDGLKFTGFTTHEVDLTNAGLTMSNSGIDTIATLLDNHWDLTFDDSVDQKMVDIVPTQIEVEERASGAGSSALSVTNTARGTRYGGTASPGETSFKTLDIRKASFDYAGTFGSRNTEGNYKTSGAVPSIILTDIPANSKIFSMWCEFTGTASAELRLVPCAIIAIDNTGTDVEIDSFYLLTNEPAAGGADAPNTGVDVTLYIEYEANSI